MNSSCVQDILWFMVTRLIRFKFPQVKRISPTELANWLNQETDRPILLDVRTAAEYQVSHLAEAQLAPRQSEDLQHRTDWQQRPIVLYCSVGYRSARLAAKMQNLGFDQVWNLEGSIFAWANQGYPVYRSDERVYQVHPYNSQWGQLLYSNLRYQCFED